MTALIILNFLFIYPTRPCTLGTITFTIPGLGLGVIGAAIASAIAFAFGGIYMTVALWRHPVITPKGQRLTPDLKILKPCLQVALPNMLQRFGTSLGYVAFASMINSLGDTATAAHTIANTVESAFYIPGYGMQSAAAALAGCAYGEKDSGKLRKLAQRILWIEVLLMCMSGAALFLLAPHMVKLFSVDQQVIMLGSVILRMVALSEPFYGFSIIVEGMLQGMGRTRFSLVLNLLGMWGVRILGTWLCTRYLGAGLITAWGCMIGHNMLLFIVYAVLYISGGWNVLEKSEKST